jgi:tRNA G18 (ribose-2'-O)-methylase SpoU
MKGYFGIGVEGISKAMNVGTLFRTAHAFGASFVFTVRAQYNRREGGHSDTSDTPRSVPTYHFADLESFRLPQGCRLVGVEISDDAIDLPSFRHPRQAAYVLGAEREGLSQELQSRCDYVVKIPTRFSVNLGVAGALIMYDRLLSLGRHAPRPVAEGAPTEAVPLPVFGDPIYKRKARQRQGAKQRAGS